MTEQQRVVNVRVSAHVPNRAWESTVAIVVAHPPRVHLLGTGVLFQIADCPFVVTAGHVARLAHKYRKTVGIGNTGHATLIPFVTGEWTSSVPPEGSETDPHDLAVYPLPGDIVAKLTAKRFLRIGDVSFEDPGPRAVFTLFGYPGAWSKSSEHDDSGFVKGLEFTTYAFDGDVSTLTEWYQPRLHLLLAAGPEYTTWPDGSPADFRDRLGQPLRFPVGLKGISGCSVWHIGDLSVPIEKWGAVPARVVGVETGAFQTSGVITATRWALVTTIIHKAFPDLRRSIELWSP
jgi:hypothetical protein